MCSYTGIIKGVEGKADAKRETTMASKARAFRQSTGGWVLYVGTERVGWWFDWNSLADYCSTLGIDASDVIQVSPINGLVTR